MLKINQKKFNIYNINKKIYFHKIIFDYYIIFSFYSVINFSKYWLYII